MFIPHTTLAKYVARLTISIISGAAMVLLKDYLHKKRNRQYR